MPQSTVPAAAVTAATNLLEVLAQTARVKVDLDTAFFAPPVAADNRTAEPAGAPAIRLLPADYTWRPDPAKGSRIPLQLCEFLSYKTALAYEPEDRIRDN